MKKRNKVVFTSMATVAMCASMIAGGTYALFTSESKVNVAVTSGTVKVEATASDLTLYSKGVEQSGSTFEVGGSAIKDGNRIKIDRMAPMDSVKFDIEIENYSDISVQYRTVISVVEDTGLFSALKVTFEEDGKTQVFGGGYAYADWTKLDATDNDATTADDVSTINVSIEFPDGDNQNGYQGKSCEIAVTVEAVQGNASVVNPVTQTGERSWDVNSEEGMMLMKGIIESNDHAEGRELNFRLTDDMDMTGYAWNVPNVWMTNIDGNGKTVSNVTCGQTDRGWSGFVSYFGGGYIKNLTLENVTAVGSQAGIVAGHADGGWLENVTIKGTNSVTYQENPVETWGGVGVVAGVSTEGLKDGSAIVIANGASVSVNYNGILTESSYANEYAFINDISGYVAKNGTVTTTGTWGKYLADGLYLMADGTYKIMNANGLVYANENYFAKGGTFKLENSVDMTGIAWTPVNVGAEFAFDGGNNTIANLTVDTVGSVDGMGAVGFVLGYSRSGNISISDVTFDGAKIVGDGKGNTNGAVVLASSHRHSANTVVMKNVTVQNSTVEACDRSGGLLGYVDAKSTVTLTDCKVNGNVIESVGTAGALLAYPQGVAVTINGFEAKNNTISSSEGSNKAGIVIGTIASPITVTVDDLNVAVTGSTAINAGEATDNFAGRYVSGSLTVNGSAYVASDAQLSTVLETSETELSILLGNGAYNNFRWGMSNVKNVVVTGTNKAIVSAEGNDQHSLGGSTVTFNGVTIKGGASGYNGFTYYAKVTYNDCVIVNQNYLYGETYFNACTFELAAGCYIYTYGASVVEVDNCEFNTAGKALIMYKDGNMTATLTVKNSVFNASEAGYAGTIGNQACAAIEIDNYGSSAYTLITEGNTVDIEFSGEWRIKNILADTVITVNGAQYSKANGDVFLDGVAYTLANNQVSEATA